MGLASTLLKILLIIAVLATKISSLLPTNFWWGNVNGTNYLTYQRNQLNPIYCGSCWSFAITSSLNDRIKIMRKAAWPDIILSPQVMLSCDTTNKGCDGGNTMYAFKWIKQNYLTDQTCSPYQGLGHDTGLGCSDMIKCKICNKQKGCIPEMNGKIYQIESYGQLPFNQEALMKEIYERGPIVCMIAINDAIEQEYTGGIFIDTTGIVGEDHVVSINGWGVQNGTKFWNVRNSYGSQWGEGGNFRIIRGVNNLGIQQNCSWGQPKDTWTNHLTNTITNTQPTQANTQTQSSQQNICKRQSPKLLFKNLPQISFKYSQVPSNWDWRNVNGKNYLSATRNSRVPKWCASCWVHSPISCIADRINIARDGVWPDINLSPQVLINCHAGGSCEGGNPGQVFVFANQNGIPQENCQPYTATNPDKFECTDIKRCNICVEDDQTRQQECFPEPHYYVWKVKNYGIVYGSDRMKAQILQRGPISCGIDSTSSFENYKGGIYSEEKQLANINTEVSIVGWGIENGVEYWIGRHSLGTYWGEFGFFRILMHRNNLGIQTDCSWGEVDKIPHLVVVKQTNKENHNLKIQLLDFS